MFTFTRSVSLATLAIAALAATAAMGSPKTAAAINIDGVMDGSRTALVQHYPNLSDREIDLLTFRIADAMSMRGIETNR